MIISLISALTVADRVIGMKNFVPWCLPLDMKWFKYHTVNKPIIMGRRTFESIGKRALQNRLNIVLSRVLLSHCHDDVYIVNSVNQALRLVKDFYEVMIIGGSEIYSIFLPQSTRLYLTYVSANTCIYGDAWFPVYDISEWKSIFSKYCSMCEQGSYYNLSFNIFERFKKI